jgi:hypothetical protein
MIAGNLPTRHYIGIEQTNHQAIALDLLFMCDGSFGDGHCGLDKRQNIARHPAGTKKILFSKNILTGPEIHPTTYLVHTERLFFKAYGSVYLG